MNRILTCFHNQVLHADKYDLSQWNETGIAIFGDVNPGNQSPGILFISWDLFPESRNYDGSE